MTNYCEKKVQLSVNNATNLINVKEYRNGNTKLTIQRNWQHRVHKSKKNKNTTQYVLDTTMRKQTQIT